MNLQDVHDNEEIVDEVGCVSALYFTVERRCLIGYLKFYPRASDWSKYQNLYISAFDFLGHNKVVAFL